MEKEKKYRPNVAAVILSPLYPLECRIFIAQRYDIKGAWQFPQGGIDKGEKPKEALLRELDEEIGTNDIEILCEHPEWLSYDFPENIAQKMSPYDGQIQKYFLVRLKPKAKINLKTKHPEFDDYKFIKENRVLENVNHFKKSVYHKVLKYFKEEGYI
ncbi:dinucleoside polyphosphate hydrolase [Campylobacter hyointestinalis]|uniref:Dinucleoside polyphosphate hydrolase n=1 Tax=Campylobacter hyointestinalis subsp. hyointestinalis TaxID=91352 RepID=A0A855N727_CAMHY|nr:RNA pyrophosphohydrolase [Campylobacter hyointestinalis]ANE32324.1 RNA pyrophosphohydrolase [Campylobacter hyointestinalis subsp. hyointestinalis LMG 9260]MDL2347567.1 RNA pyrophosphohydrolase [Campylobacter hyointestinalis]MDL2349215.1 RNA pyrophosphohydrolase [Campylobacter hyointestinalis]MDL2351057.1 RNA pyrophosphohydrolase [Campylobacter hyointestinalis]MDM1026887.1 RNA pyrophosphohydrolase [Campylobacter hyointestinalis]